MQQTIVIRKSATAKNKNHNLYTNGPSAVWWCSLTVWDGIIQKRLRFSLKTKDIKKARELRDKIINDARRNNLLTWR